METIAIEMGVEFNDENIYYLSHLSRGRRLFLWPDLVRFRFDEFRIVWFHSFYFFRS